MNPKTTPFLVLLVFTFHLVLGQEKYSTVKIYAPADRMQRTALIGLLQIDHFQETTDGAIVSEISSGDMEKLKETNYRYEVIIDDMVAHLKSANRKYFSDLASGKSASKMAMEQSGSIVDAIIRTPDAFRVQTTFGGYYSFAQMETAMTNLISAYPNLAQRTTLGRTEENRNIWCIKISDNVDTDEEDEPEVLFIGLQHAREAIGGSSMIFLMQYLCEEYSRDSRIRDLVNNREIFIIPCMNPDGWEYNRTNGGAGSGWRKNRSDGGTGVDLNRNWKYNWGNCRAPISGVQSSCGSNSPSSDTYYGDSAFSERETRAIRDFTLTHHLVAMIDQHCYGPYYSLPFGRPSITSNVMSASDRRFYTHISSAMGNYNGMRSGNSLEALGYEVAGGVKDWMLKGDSGIGTKRKVYGLTGEGGGGGFWAPANRIVNLCKGMVFQNLQLLYAAGSYVNLQDRNDINITATEGAFNFNMIRTGLENRPVVVTAVPIENIIITGTPVIVSNLTTYGSSYTGGVNYRIPAGLSSGQRIRFAWKVETGGYSWSDTVTKFYNAVEVFSDDMESGTVGTRWTVTGGWNYTGEDAFAGSRSFAESPGGNYTSSSTRRATTVNTLNLGSATAAYLSFWVKHRAENFYDKLQIQVSTDGVNWIAIPGTTTVQEQGTADGSTLNGRPALTGLKEDWTRELFDLRDYLGEENLRLRFEFTSGPSSDYAFSEDDGFHIDNIKVVKSTVPLIALPVHFISFTGELLPDETVRLDWVAETDDMHDYFEVEKATTGGQFVSIGRGPSSAPYWMIDRSPAPGNNFYRIKQRDKNGTITYSNTINIQYRPPFTIAAYPSPFHDVLNIKITSSVPDRYTISLVDISGRTVFEERVSVNGSTTRDLNPYLKQDAAQVLILIVRNGRNEIVSTQKITKE